MSLTQKLFTTQQHLETAESSGTLSPELQKLKVEFLSLLGTYRDRVHKIIETGKLEDKEGTYAMAHKLQELCEKVEKELEIVDMERLFHVKENYEAQTNHYRELGWLEEEDGKEGIRDKEGSFYPMPTVQEIFEELNKKAALLQYKEKQSFKRFLLVPFGLSYIEMYKKLGEEYIRYREDPDLELYRTDKAKTRIMQDTDYGSFPDVMEEEDLLYYKEQQEKSELIKSQRFPAWEIHILPEKMTLAREGKGETTGYRPEIEANMKFGDYAKLVNGEIDRSDGKPIRDAEGQLVYRGESGLTPESEIALAFVQLRENNQVLHDYYENPNDAACVLSGCLTKSGDIPYSCFNPDYDLVFMYGGIPDDQDEDHGSCVSVKVC